MDFNQILEDKKISKYKLSKLSGVPYSTICDISTGKSDLLKCSAETVVRLSHILEIKVEDFVPEISFPEVKKSKSVSRKKEKSTGSGDKDNKTYSRKKGLTDSKNNNHSKIEQSAVPGKKEASDSCVAKKDTSESFAARKEQAYLNYCQDLRNKIEEMGELNFLITYLKNNEVEILFNLNRKRESKYLLEIVDELCVKYKFPLCKEYDEIRAEEIS